MLIKLIKHDCIAMGRLLLPVMIALLVLSTVIGISFRIQFSGDLIVQITVILIAVLFALICLAFFLTFLLTMLRFKQNLLGNQGYLSFSLPVSTVEHIASKYLSSILWTLLNAAISVGCFLIIYKLAIPYAERRLGAMLMDQYMPDFKPADYLTFENFLVFFSAVTEGILHLYMAISIGHLWQKHSVLGAVFSYVGLSILRSQLYLSLLQALPSSFPMTRFTILIAFFFSIVYAVFTWFILDRKLNLE